MALGTCKKFQLEILAINMISGIVYFREIILESSRSVGETSPQSNNRYGIDPNAGINRLQHQKSQKLYYTK